MSQKTINPLQLKIKQIQIERVHEFNFLYFTINEHLNWRDHIEKNSNKTSKTMGILNKLKHFLPNKPNYTYITHSYYHISILVFLHRVISMIEYSNYRKNILCIICISKYNAHTEPLFKSMNLLKVSNILQLQLLKFYYKYKNKMLPYYLTTIYNPG